MTTYDVTGVICDVSPQGHGSVSGSSVAMTDAQLIEETILFFTSDTCLEEPDDVLADFVAVLHTILATDRSLAIRPDMEITHALRNEVLLCMVLIKRRILESVEATILPADFESVVQNGIGIPITNVEFTRYCEHYITSRDIDGLKDTDMVDTMKGRLLAANAATYIETRFSVSMMAFNETDDTIRRFEEMIVNMGRLCSFETLGDYFMDTCCNARLYCERLATMAYTERPRYQLPLQFKERTNSVVRPYVDIRTWERADALDFTEPTQTDDFVFVTSILKEMIDNNAIEIYVNTQLSFYRGPAPQLYVMSGNFDVYGRGFGVVCGTKLLPIDIAQPHAISILLLYYIRQWAQTSDSYAAFLACCETPDIITKANIYKQYVTL